MPTVVAFVSDNFFKITNGHVLHLDIVSLVQY